MNKIVVSLFIVWALFSLVSCQNQVKKDAVSSVALEKEFLLAPSNDKYYDMSMTFNSTKISLKAPCSFEKEDNEIRMTVTVKELNWSGDSQTDKAINDGYQQYVGEKYTSFFDNYGKPMLNKSFDKKIINSELLVIEFPKYKIKEGDSWTGRKDAKPDMFFDKFEVTYKLKSIEKNKNVIEVEMVGVLKDDTEPMFQSLTKSMKGSYIVNDDGTVKSAELDYSGFSGLSNINGNITIKEIPVQSR